MLSKNKAKYIQSLRLKKNRLKNRAFLVEGEKIVRELLQDGKNNVEMVCATPTWIRTYPQDASLLKEMLMEVSEAELKKISTLKTPNQVLAVAKMPDSQVHSSDIQNHLHLYLDGIQDPGNMGTILRIADWFGIPYVFCSPQSVDLYNPKVIQASMGAFLRVQYHQIPFEDLVRLCPEMPTFGATLKGENIFKLSLPSAGIIVIGNEGNGISDAILNQIQHTISIPAASPMGAESLNAGIATGIICALFRNQNNQ